MDLKQRAQSLKRQIPAVWLSLKDKQPPLVAKLLAGVIVGYALSPFDLIPDFIPVFGYLDDLVILPALIALMIKLIPKDIWEKNLLSAESLWPTGKPKTWYYAIPIIIIWLGILYWLARVLGWIT